MFIRLLNFLFLIFCSTASATEQETPYTHILNLHQQSPLDFASLAAEAAQLRADYNRVVVKMLSSEEYTQDQRFDFAQNYRSDYFVKALSIWLTPESRAHASRLIHAYAENYNCPYLKTKIGDANNMLQALLIMDAMNAMRLWTFLANSLRAYASNPEDQSLEFTNKLLLECARAVDYADSDVANNSDQADGACAVKNMLDEANYARFLLESMFLHATLNKKYDQDQIQIYRLACELLTDIKQTKRDMTGIGTAFCLFYADPVLKQRAEVLVNKVDDQPGDLVQTKVEELKRSRFVIPSHEIKVEIVRLTAEGAFDDLVGPYLVCDFVRWRTNIYRLPQPEKTRFLNRVNQFYYTKDCRSFKLFLDEAEILGLSLVKERRDVLAASFLLGVKEPKAPAKRTGARNKKNKKNEESPVSDKGKEEVSAEPVKPATPPLATQGPLTPKVKAPTTKQKRLMKKQAKQEETRLVMNQLVHRAEARTENNANLPAQIQITFDPEYTPKIEEIQLYRLIWGPDSARKTMGWAELKGRLEGFGWTVGYTGGSCTTLTPPVWFAHVQVAAPAELNVHFRNSGIMVHQPHNEAEAPMPSYVIGFLREQLGNNIGLSDIVVQAMKIKLEEEKAHN